MGKLLVIVGPTASGKTNRAVSVAKRFGGEIISADSRQIYRGMDLGTGKDLEEYDGVPYHLIDIRPAGDKYNLFEYLREASAVRRDIEGRDRLAVVCGGTGMYVEALLNGLALPEVPVNEGLRKELEGQTLEELTRRLERMKTLHNVTDMDTCKRAIRAIEIQTYYLEHPELAVATRPEPVKDAVIIGIDIDRDTRRRRITERLHSRLESGMVDEVRRLIDSGVAPEDLIYYGLEYKFLTLYVTGQMTYDDMVKGLETAIHQFAKRQMTWFRGMERRGFTIDWMAWDMPEDEFLSHIAERLK
ncbi:MAG: tRNA (adenosine(37)-N6)-dimethylallyltransferase MiaA [Paramuribaculum sp.]|nr:tRNA (adenosine(37)-N6)-dimethylallyltransferase MiaA [Paramuribaculum sp.]